MVSLVGATLYPSVFFAELNKLVRKLDNRIPKKKTVTKKVTKEPSQLYPPKKHQTRAVIEESSTPLPTSSSSRCNIFLYYGNCTYF